MNQNFFDMLIQDAAADAKRSGKWMIGIGVISLAVGVIALLLLEELIGLLFFGALAVLLFVILIFQQSKIKKMLQGSSGDLKFLKTYGVGDQKDALVRKLDEDYQAGKLLFHRNDKKMRLFVFPQYLVYTAGTSINVIAENKLYWAYLTVHKKNGAVTGRIVSFFTDQEEITMNVPEEEFAHALFEQLAISYSLWSGFDDKLKKLYNKDRAEFIRRMDAFKWYKQIPVEQ